MQSTRYDGTTTNVMGACYGKTKVNHGSPKKELKIPPGGMTTEEYRRRGRQMVDYIADYLDNIRSRRVFPDVQPGYMQELVPDQAPECPEKWEDIMADVENVVMPGMTHWQSPYMHAYFPALNCYPSLLAEMLADAINCLGFTWASSPACTELETIVMDWLAQMLGLPQCFLHGRKKSAKMGGGCIQTTASDCTYVTMLAARTEAIRRVMTSQPDLDAATINGRLIGYCSDQAHSSVEKASTICMVQMRFLATDDNLCLRGSTLEKAMKTDRQNGLIPFFVCATLGTTGACAFDNLKEIGPICETEQVWLHIDAAYAGSAFICPEFRHFMEGIEYADSLAFNPSKWLMVHFDCSAMWVKDAGALHRTFNVEPLYLQHENSGAAIDYMHWQIGLSRRFRSLKLWFVLRAYGVTGLQQHIRKGVELAAKFEELVRSDDRFEVAAPRHLGMVVFRLAGANELTEELLKKLNKQGKIHMVPASLQGNYVIRFTVTSQFTTLNDIQRDWTIITNMTERILDTAISRDSYIDESEEEEEVVEVESEEGRLLTKAEKEEEVIGEGYVPAKKSIALSKRTSFKSAVKSRASSFGISLLLSNVPMSPKVVNGSFAAFFDETSPNTDLLAGSITDLSGFLRPSPRRRLKLSDFDRHRSLDYSVLVNRKTQPMLRKTMGSLDSKIDNILESSPTDPDNKNTNAEDEQFDRKLTDARDTNQNSNTLPSQDDRVLDQEHWDTGPSKVKVGSLPVGNGGMYGDKCLCAYCGSVIYVPQANNTLSPV